MIHTLGKSAEVHCLKELLVAWREVHNIMLIECNKLNKDCVQYDPRFSNLKTIYTQIF